MKRKFLLAVLIAVFAFSGCGEEDANSSPVINDVQAEPLEVPSKDSSEGQTSTPENNEQKGELTDKPWQTYTGKVTAIGERVVVDGKMQSWLTGEWKDEAVAKRRNIAVMIPDNTPSLPQYGLSKASIVYESPVEGRFTRLMGLFEDYDELDRIGPVRSSRRYYVDEAMAFDSIYCNWGLARTWVEEIINSDMIDNVSQSLAGIYNGAPEAYGRIDRPGYAKEFTGYLMLDGFKQAVDRLGYEETYTDRFQYAFQFADDDCWATYSDKPDVTEIWPGGKGKNRGGYGNYGENNVHFEYNPEDGLYYRYQYGGPHTDEYNGEQIAVRNIIFKVCKGGEYFPDDPSHDYLWFDVFGEDGGCYVFTNGKMITCTWNRKDEFSPNVLLDADGNEVILNQGKTWICNIWSDYQNYIELY